MMSTNKHIETSKTVLGHFRNIFLIFPKKKLNNELEIPGHFLKFQETQRTSRSSNNI